MNPDDPQAPQAQQDPQEAELLAAAWHAREAALCPYSKFAVGAAILDGEGRVWTGANVENASYTLGLCAERVALFYALTHGARDIRSVVVVTGAATPSSPCGACRQILFEFAAKATLVSATAGDQVLRIRVRDLLPHGFDASSLA
ncbi:MAG TPA: cytidine deaminase [Nannocystis sp.]|jgi:cytidine deaminase